jgi:enamine deaminase RidA (YjgF/YER057c/UK114 family)
MTHTFPDRRLISSGSPFERIYGYSRAVVRGDEVLIAGTTGYDYAKMAMLADIVRLHTFVTDAAYCEPVLKVQGEVFGEVRPAATIVVVSALLKPEMKVEIEAEARLARRT